MCPQWLPGTYHALVAFSEGRIKSMAMLAGMALFEWAERLRAGSSARSAGVQLR